MKRSLHALCFFLTLCNVNNVFSQQKSLLTHHKDDLPGITDTITTAEIIWDLQERKISHDTYFAEYGRVKRLSGDTVLLVYHFGSKGNEWDNVGM